MEARPRKRFNLPVTSYAQQYRRQRVSDTWEPAGFDRYQYQQALLRSMNVLGGPGGAQGVNPDRYIPGGDNTPA